ncbi:hypothetical protein SHLA_54c000440 [Shinella sp. DD12]|jgi:DNA end-binding protein Ku|nr:hypothetical protein SHLA_54c000440 [Shinella sp. DD12]
MAGHRAQWKGFIKFGEVSCGVGLYTAASTSERIAFHTINKKTGNRVNRVFIDSDTGKEVEREDQTKGFEIENGQYIMIDPEEVAATIPESNKTMTSISTSPTIWCRSDYHGRRKAHDGQDRCNA